MRVKRHFLPVFFVVAALTAFFLVRHLQTAGHNVPPIADSGYFYDKSGHKVTLADFRGKVVLLNFWATWCTPCAAEMPSLDRLQEILPANRFSVVAVSLDRGSEKPAEIFMKKNEIKNLSLYWDKDRKIPEKWKYDGLPTSFLIDAEGKILKRYAGNYEWDKEPLLGEIKRVLR